MTARFRRARRSIALLAVVAAAAVVPPAHAADASCRPADSWPRQRADLAAEILAMTNAHRATLRLAPLAVSSSLTDAATWKAAHMANFEYMDHDDPAPPVARTFAERVQDCGYSSGAGENLAYGYRTPADAFAGWLGSDGHRSNLEHTGYKVIGIGVAVTPEGRPYWSQVFGTRVQSGDLVSSVPPPPLPSATPAPTPTPAPSPTPTPPVVAPSPENVLPDLGSERPPVARDDSIATAEDAAVRVAPLANDEDPERGSLRIVSLGAPAHGDVTVSDARELLYTPDPDYNGSDTFEYTVLDDSQLRSTASVTVRVEPRNDSPTAKDDDAVARPRRRVVLHPLSNDYDVDGDRLRVRAIRSGPFFGSLDRDGDALIYRPHKRARGRVDLITYRVSDENGAIATGTIQVRIRR